MKQLLAVLTVAMLATFATSAAAQITIEITEGNRDATPIAIVPFGRQGVGLPSEDLAQIVDSDLARSGQFLPIARTDMLGRPSIESEVFFRDWGAINAKYLLIGRESMNGPQLRVDYELFDVTSQRKVFSGYEAGSVSDARMLAHRLADEIYEHITSVPGAFATRLLYIAVTRVPGGKDYSRLTMSDSDGARPIVLLETQEPLLAPTWSPDGKDIAYVSFETGRPAIYRQELATGRRQQLTNFKGLNGAPAWSPDGKTMAMTLSKDGNPDIYLMDLATKQLTQIIRHYAIDTEPAWMPDGKSLLFTSDRGGKPQIYRYYLDSGKTDRLTHEGSYNARARVSQDGRSVVMVHQQDGRFHIAVLDLVTNRVTSLTSTELDESPSIAPNGSMVLYATKYAGRGILSAVAVDGDAKFRLPAREGDVREPAWSPYISR